MEILKKQRGTQGFTIIEVMIVLAIAAVIMLIVFLAVPALQRNSRNNQRNNDAARVAAAVNECLANRNGITGSCDDASEISVGQLSRLDSITFGAATYSQSAASVTFGNQCTNGGDAAQAGGGSRAFAVTYQLEPAIPRCIAS